VGDDAEAVGGFFPLELLLVGTKGDVMLPAEGVRESSVYREKNTTHSKKPDYYYGLIERMCPNGKYLELFARKRHSEKWAVWGNEVETVDAEGESAPVNAGDGDE
jgi:N6-adenosine-specific RNA methylase IME4